MPRLSVILPTHNPHRGRLARTLAGLRGQTMPGSSWETVLVDNVSTPALDDTELAALSPPNLRIVCAPTLGLTSARRRGFAEARGEFLVLVDDDNVLAPDYLENVLRCFQTHPQLGAIGGPSRPEFESTPPAWAVEFFPLLALRDLGPAIQIAPLERVQDGTHYAYPTCAPIGAGMALRKAALSSWLASADATSLTDRRGTALTSGGDNDIVLSLLHAGWQVGYFPELAITHLISASRLLPEYLARLNEGIQASWVKVLTRHNACSWTPIARWTVPLRQARAWFRYRGWQRPAGYIRWRGACGHFRGRAEAASLRAAPSPPGPSIDP